MWVYTCMICVMCVYVYRGGAYIMYVCMETFQSCRRLCSAQYSMWICTYPCIEYACVRTDTLQTCRISIYKYACVFQSCPIFIYIYKIYSDIQSRPIFICIMCPYWYIQSWPIFIYTMCTSNLSHILTYITYICTDKFAPYSYIYNIIYMCTDKFQFSPFIFCPIHGHSGKSISTHEKKQKKTTFSVIYVRVAVVIRPAP